MSKTTKTILGIVLVLAVILGIGYAAISATNGTVTGTANAKADQNEFDVKFTGVPTLDTENSTTGVTLTSDSVDGLNATFTVGNLTKAGDEAVVKYVVTNASGSSLRAILEQTNDISCTNGEYFSVTSNLETGTEYQLVNGGTQDVIITVTLDKLPIEDISSTITLNLSATPVEAE